MRFNKFLSFSPFVSLRDTRLKIVSRVDKKKRLEFFVCELE